MDLAQIVLLVNLLLSVLGPSPVVGLTLSRLLLLFSLIKMLLELQCLDNEDVFDTITLSNDQVPNSDKDDNFQWTSDLKLYFSTRQLTEWLLLGKKARLRSCTTSLQAVDPEWNQSSFISVMQVG